MNVWFEHEFNIAGIASIGRYGRPSRAIVEGGKRQVHCRPKVLRTKTAFYLSSDLLPLYIRSSSNL